MQSFSTFMMAENVLLETVKTAFNLLIEAELHNFTDEDWAFIADELKKRRETYSKDRKKNLPPMTGYQASGKKQRLPKEYEFPNVLRQALEHRAPIHRAWLDVGIDGDPTEVLSMLKEKGQNVFPSDAYVRGYGIARLKQLRAKAINDPNSPMNERERAILQAWQKGGKGSMVKSSEYPDEFKKDPETLYDEFDKQGKRDLVITGEEAELAHIGQVRDEVARGQLPHPDKYENLSQRTYEKAISKWRGVGSEKVADKAHAGIEQWLTDPDEGGVGGDPDEMPNIFVAPKVKESSLRHDPQILDKMRNDPQLWVDTVVKPACQAVTKHVISKAASWGEPLSQLLGAIQPGQEGATGLQSDTTSPVPASLCGAGGSEILDAVNNWLGKGDGDFANLVSQVIHKLENSTSYMVDGKNYLETSHNSRLGLAYKLAMNPMAKIWRRLTQIEKIQKGQADLRGERGARGQASHVGGAEYAGGAAKQASKAQQAATADISRAVTSDERFNRIRDELADIEDDLQGGMMSDEDAQQAYDRKMELLSQMKQLMASNPELATALQQVMHGN